MEGALAGWRDEARQTVQAALQRLPADLSDQKLAEHQEALAAPLQVFLDTIDQVSGPAKVAALPGRGASSSMTWAPRSAAWLRPPGRT